MDGTYLQRIQYQENYDLAYLDFYSDGNFSHSNREKDSAAHRTIDTVGDSQSSEKILSMSENSYQSDEVFEENNCDKPIEKKSVEKENIATKPPLTRAARARQLRNRKSKTIAIGPLNYSDESNNSKNPLTPDEIMHRFELQEQIFNEKVLYQKPKVKHFPNNHRILFSEENDVSCHHLPNGIDQLEYLLHHMKQLYKLKGQNSKLQQKVSYLHDTKQFLQFQNNLLLCKNNNIGCANVFLDNDDESESSKSEDDDGLPYISSLKKLHRSQSEGSINVMEIDGNNDIVIDDCEKNSAKRKDSHYLFSRSQITSKWEKVKKVFSGKTDGPEKKTDNQTISAEQLVRANTKNELKHCSKSFSHLNSVEESLATHKSTRIHRITSSDSMHFLQGSSSSGEKQSEKCPAGRPSENKEINTNSCEHTHVENSHYSSSNNDDSATEKPKIIKKPVSGRKHKNRYLTVSQNNLKRRQSSPTLFTGETSLIIIHNKHSNSASGTLVRSSSFKSNSGARPQGESKTAPTTPTKEIEFPAGQSPPQYTMSGCRRHHNKSAWGKVKHIIHNRKDSLKTKGRHVCSNEDCKDEGHTSDGEYLYDDDIDFSDGESSRSVSPMIMNKDSLTQNSNPMETSSSSVLENDTSLTDSGVHSIDMQTELNTIANENTEFISKKSTIVSSEDTATISQPPKSSTESVKKKHYTDNSSQHETAEVESKHSNDVLNETKANAAGLSKQCEGIAASSTQTNRESVIMPSPHVGNVDVSALIGGFSEEFHKKLQEWEDKKKKGFFAELSPDEDKPTVDEETKFSEEFIKKMEEWERMKGLNSPLKKNRVSSPPGENSSPDVDGQAPEEFLSESFSKTVQEWERIKTKRVKEVPTSPAKESESASTTNSTGSAIGRSPTEKQSRKSRKAERSKSRDRTTRDRSKSKYERQREKEMKKIEQKEQKIEKEKEKLLKMKIKMEALQTMTEADVQGLSDEFAKRLKEWEIMKGLRQADQSPDVLTMTDLTNGREKISHSRSNSAKQYRESKEGKLERERTVSEGMNLGSSDISLARIEASFGKKELSQQRSASLPSIATTITQMVDENTSIDLNITADTSSRTPSEYERELQEELRQKEEDLQSMAYDMQQLTERINSMNDEYNQQIEQYKREIWATSRYGQFTIESDLIAASLKELHNHLEQLRNTQSKMIVEKEDLQKQLVNETSLRLLAEENFILRFAKDACQTNNAENKQVEQMQEFLRNLLHQMHELKLGVTERNNILTQLQRRLLEQKVTIQLLEVDVQQRKMEVAYLKEAYKKGVIKRRKTFAGSDQVQGKIIPKNNLVEDREKLLNMSEEKDYSLNFEYCKESFDDISPALIESFDKAVVSSQVQKCSKEAQTETTLSHEECFEASIQTSESLSNLKSEESLNDEEELADIEPVIIIMADASTDTSENSVVDEGVTPDLSHVRPLLKDAACQCSITSTINQQLQTESISKLDDLKIEETISENSKVDLIQKSEFDTFDTDEWFDAPSAEPSILYKALNISPTESNSFSFTDYSKFHLEKNYGRSYSEGASSSKKCGYKSDDSSIYAKTNKKYQYHKFHTHKSKIKPNSLSTESNDVQISSSRQTRSPIIKSRYPRRCKTDSKSTIPNESRNASTTDKSTKAHGSTFEDDSFEKYEIEVKSDIECSNTNSSKSYNYYSSKIIDDNLNKASRQRAKSESYMPEDIRNRVKRVTYPILVDNYEFRYQRQNRVPPMHDIITQFEIKCKDMRWNLKRPTSPLDSNIQKPILLSTKHLKTAKELLLDSELNKSKYNSISKKRFGYHTDGSFEYSTPYISNEKEKEKKVHNLIKHFSRENSPSINPNEIEVSSLQEETSNILVRRLSNPSLESLSINRPFKEPICDNLSKISPSSPSKKLKDEFTFIKSSELPLDGTVSKNKDSDSIPSTPRRRVKDYSDFTKSLDISDTPERPPRKKKDSQNEDEFDLILENDRSDSDIASIDSSSSITNSYSKKCTLNALCRQTLNINVASDASQNCDISGHSKNYYKDKDKDRQSRSIKSDKENRKFMSISLDRRKAMSRVLDSEIFKNPKNFFKSKNKKANDEG